MPRTPAAGTNPETKEREVGKNARSTTGGRKRKAEGNNPLTRLLSFLIYKYLFQIKNLQFRACLNFAQVNFANKIGETDRKQTQKNLIEY